MGPVRGLRELNDAFLAPALEGRCPWCDTELHRASDFFPGNVNTKLLTMSYCASCRQFLKVRRQGGGIIECETIPAERWKA